MNIQTLRSKNVRAHQCRTRLVRPRAYSVQKLLGACCVLGLIDMLACSSTHSVQTKPWVHGIIVHPIDLDSVVLAEGVIAPRTALPTSLSKGSCLYVFAQGTWIVTASTNAPGAFHLQQRTPAGAIVSSFDITISKDDVLQGTDADRLRSPQCALQFSSYEQPWIGGDINTVNLDTSDVTRHLIVCAIRSGHLACTGPEGVPERIWPKDADHAWVASKKTIYVATAGTSKVTLTDAFPMRKAFGKHTTHGLYVEIVDLYKKPQFEYCDDSYVPLPPLVTESSCVELSPPVTIGLSGGTASSRTHFIGRLADDPDIAGLFRDGKLVARVPLPVPNDQLISNEDRICQLDAPKGGIEHHVAIRNIGASETKSISIGWADKLFLVTIDQSACWVNVRNWTEKSKQGTPKDGLLRIDFATNLAKFIPTDIPAPGVVSTSNGVWVVTSTPADRSVKVAHISPDLDITTIEARNWFLESFMSAATSDGGLAVPANGIHSFRDNALVEFEAVTAPADLPLVVNGHDLTDWAGDLSTDINTVALQKSWHVADAQCDAGLANRPNARVALSAASPSARLDLEDVDDPTDELRIDCHDGEGSRFAARFSVRTLRPWYKRAVVQTALLCAGLLAATLLILRLFSSRRQIVALAVSGATIVGQQLAPTFSTLHLSVSTIWLSVSYVSAVILLAVVGVCRPSSLRLTLSTAPWTSYLLALAPIRRHVLDVAQDWDRAKKYGSDDDFLEIPVKIKDTPMPHPRQQCIDAIEQRKLVMIVGVGGVGKTMLAHAVLRTIREAHSDWLVASLAVSSGMTKDAVIERLGAQFAPAVRDLVLESILMTGPACLLLESAGELAVPPYLCDLANRNADLRIIAVGRSIQIVPPIAHAALQVDCIPVTDEIAKQMETKWSGAVLQDSLRGVALVKDGDADRYLPFLLWLACQLDKDPGTVAGRSALFERFFGKLDRAALAWIAEQFTKGYFLSSQGRARVIPFDPAAGTADSTKIQAAIGAGILRHEANDAASYARCIHDSVLAHLVAHGLRLLVGIDEKRIVAVMLEAASTPELVSLADPDGRPGGELYWAFVERVAPWSISRTGVKEVFGSILSVVAGMMREDEVRQALSAVALQLDPGEISVRALILTAHDRASNAQRAHLVAAIAPLIARVEELRGSRAFETLRELLAVASLAGNQHRPVDQ